VNTVFELTSISIAGLRIDEPVASITDLIVSFVCLYAFFGLKKIPQKPYPAILMQYYFLTMGLATLFGGLIGHAFLYAFSFKYKLLGWLISMLSIALLERSTIEYAKPNIKNVRLFQFFNLLNIIDISFFVLLTLLTLQFFYVELHSSYGLLIVTAGFHGFVFCKTKSKASFYSLIGVGISAIAALFFMNQWIIHTWFNHIDVSHLLMSLAAWFFYKSSMNIAKGSL
jgi:hypothetical protein